MINAIMTELINAHVEFLNAWIQKLKKHANDYRNMQHFIDAIYSHDSDLNRSFST